jgi:chemotaxis-related protein WspD
MTGGKGIAVSFCWKQTGNFGDSSCPRLAELVHCRNCDEYNRAGRSLLDREMPEELREEWTRNLAGVKETEDHNAVSLIVFRVRNEWLALRTTCLQETTNMRFVHRVPFKTNNVFRGIVNVNGELLLCVSLADLIESGSEGEEKDESAAHTHKRMLVIDMDSERYAFPVDEVLGISRLSLGALAEPPVTMSKAPTTIVEGIFDVDEKKVGLLDEAKLIHSLRRSLSS